MLVLLLLLTETERGSFMHTCASDVPCGAATTAVESVKGR